MKPFIFRSVLMALILQLSNHSTQATPFIASETKQATEIEMSSASCAWPALVLTEVDAEGPFCNGDFVEVEAFGYSANGGIPFPHEVSDDYTFIWNGGAIEHIHERKVRIQIDSESDQNILEIIYALTVDGQTCRDTASIAFDLLPVLESDIAQLYWSPGDTLLVLSEAPDLCYQWGKLVGSDEVEIEGETSNILATNESEESIFVARIEDNIAIPKSTFKEIYFVKIFDCNDEFSDCVLIKYFLPENFQSVDFSVQSFDSDIILYPNPGTGEFAIKGTYFKNEDARIEIDVFSMAGILIYKKIMTTPGTSVYLSNHHVPSGLYYIKITFPDSRVKTLVYSKI